MHRRWLVLSAASGLILSSSETTAQEPLERARNCAPAIDPDTGLEYPQCPRRRIDGSITASDLKIYSIEIDGFERKVRVLYDDKVIDKSARDRSLGEARESREDLKAIHKEETSRDRE